MLRFVIANISPAMSVKTQSACRTREKRTLSVLGDQGAMFSGLDVWEKMREITAISISSSVIG
jgi:hypothetical protein